MNDLISYCFEYSAHAVEEDARAHDGRSTILERILAAKRSGECRCGITYPEGRYCLADVRRVVDQVVRGNCADA